VSPRGAAITRAAVVLASLDAWSDLLDLPPVTPELLEGWASGSAAARVALDASPLMPFFRAESDRPSRRPVQVSAPGRGPAVAGASGVVIGFRLSVDFRYATTGRARAEPPQRCLIVLACA
jgi:hypothetical protein